jgi:hypothetical protein
MEDLGEGARLQLETFHGEIFGSNAFALDERTTIILFLLAFKIHVIFSRNAMLS